MAEQHCKSMSCTRDHCYNCREHERLRTRAAAGVAPMFSCGRKECERLISGVIEGARANLAGPRERWLYEHGVRLVSELTEAERLKRDGEIERACEIGGRAASEELAIIAEMERSK